MKENVYFETIKCLDYEIFNLDYHQKRISQTVGVNFNLREYIYPPNKKLLKCKVVYSQNEIISIAYDEYKKREIKSFKLIYCNNLNYNKKSIYRLDIDNLFEKKETCDEIIIVNNDFISDTSIANIAIYYNDEWITPKKYLLRGTTLSRYVHSGLIKQKDITVRMLKNSKKIALLNAMIDFDIITQYTIKD